VMNYIDAGLILKIGGDSCVYMFARVSFFYSYKWRQSRYYDYYKNKESKLESHHNLGVKEPRIVSQLLKL